MTREQFDKAVSIERKQVGAYLGRVRAMFALEARMEFDTEVPQACYHAERLLRDRLWQELYGRRAARFHELLDELMCCNPYTEWDKQRRIISELHECAPLEPRELETVCADRV